MPSQYQEHVRKWSACRKCQLCDRRQRVVLARGTVPADVVLVGEAPGKSENALGLPFVGPAGKLLDQILQRAIPEGVGYALTNLVCCLPLYPEEGEETAGRLVLGVPDDPEVQACSDRLQEFIRIAQPKLIVCIGKTATDWLNSKKHRGIKFNPPIPMIDVTHPSAILQANYVQRGLLCQRVAMAISGAIEDYVTRSVSEEV